MGRVCCGQGQGLGGQKPALRLTGKNPSKPYTLEDLPKMCSPCDYCLSLKRRLMGKLHSLDVEEENGDPPPQP